MNDPKNLDLSGCTYNNLSIEEHLASKQNKEVKSIYKEEIEQKKNPNPIYRTPKYNSTKERSGPVETITQAHQNKHVAKNFSMCNSVRQVILALLLAGQQWSARGILKYLEKEVPNHQNLRKIFANKMPIDIKLIWNTIGIILRTEVSQFINIEMQKNMEKPGKGKIIRLYSLSVKGTSLTLEQISKLAVDKYIAPKIKKRKIKKPQHPVKQIEETIDKSDKSLDKSIGMLDRLHEIASKSKHQKLQIEVSGEIQISFKLV